MHGVEFQLRLPGNAEFASRQKLLFDKLSTAEEECNKTKTQISNINMEDVNFIEDVDVGIGIDVNVDRSQLLKLGRKTITSRFRGRESIFKRPEGPAPRAANHTIPDFHRNPHRWTKYSLEDVANEDLSEESNTRAALSFLKELKARRKSEGKKHIEDSGRILFKSKGKRGKIVKKEEGKNEFNVNGKESKLYCGRNLEESGQEQKAVFRGSRVVMPEYVVGDKKINNNNKVKKGKSVGKVDRAKQLKLAHLEEIDD
ncbi:uncharacterized protein LOC108629333 isoform X2 [Ceratina calcarata]|uniref:U5 small nuclear ribonucleoprotein TSSC4 n=1 Tax=Ceratina calcarata TaxID=156304 RepID=A0AAJ7J8Q5_9HYME|nr:uncharacterized protein LOC108629333 isoform X2 [Ceratina calcarata]